MTKETMIHVGIGLALGVIGTTIYFNNQKSVGFNGYNNFELGVNSHVSGPSSTGKCYRVIDGDWFVVPCGG